MNPSPRALRRPVHAATRAAGGLALLLLTLCLATAAPAQHDGEPSTAPPPPPGDGALTVEVRHPPSPADAGGLAVALYALDTQGRPGFVGGETDERGRVTFTGLSTDPGIVYLVGVRFRDVPFGERVAFEAGRREVSVEIEVAAPTDRVAGIVVEELRARLDWLGDRIRVREVLRVKNASQRVVLIPESQRPRAILERRLPPDALDLAAGSTSIGEGLTLEAGVMRFFGPLYPGEQRVEYEYSLPVAETRGRIPIEMREPLGQVSIVAGTLGLEATAPRLSKESQVRSDTGQPLAAWSHPALGAGERIEIDFELPDARRDAALVTIPRSDLWLELDDTRLTATADLQLEVPAGPPLAGTPDAPLFHVALPPGGEMVGVAPEAEALGLVPTEDGGFDVVGPIGPGTTSLGYSYRLAARPEGVELALGFPRPVETLNVLIADTGLALSSRRLHRRRPFRSGTRNYLHREAFNVTPDERVDLELVPLREPGLPRLAGIVITIAAAAAGALFLFAPLQRRDRAGETSEADWAPIRAERESVYASIRDLDHDYETGKLEPDDYEPMREALRERAISLLREEQAAAAEPARTASAAAARTASEAEAQTATAPSPQTTPESAGAPSIGAFCPSCGARVRAEWRFCSSCGEPLRPEDEVDA